jgi:hypothetical protein
MSSQYKADIYPKVEVSTGLRPNSTDVVGEDLIYATKPSLSAQPVAPPDRCFAASGMLAAWQPLLCSAHALFHYRSGR